MKLTNLQIRRLSHLKPGERISWGEGLTIVCRSAEPSHSGRCCQCCALHYIDCTEVPCLKGQPTDPTGPSGLLLRPTDVFFTLHHNC